MKHRESMMRYFEEKAACLRNNGDWERWLARATPEVKRVASSVNGPLLEWLAKEVGFEHADCVEFFRYGINYCLCARLLHYMICSFDA